MYIHNAFLRWLYLFTVISVVIEIRWYLRVCKRDDPWREMAASIAILAMRAPTRLVSAGITVPIGYFLWSHRVTTSPLDTAWGVALLFLAEEFAYYRMHRAGHEIRWLWASHVMHHTPEQIHLASAFRLQLQKTRLPADCLQRVPSQLSGRQQQRVNIARALCVTPRLLVADEIVAGLDLSVQAQILILLLALGRELDIGLLFIFHDLAPERYLCTRVAVMHRGATVERGETDEVFTNPRHDYTRRLLDAVPSNWGDRFPASVNLL